MDGGSAHPGHQRDGAGEEWAPLLALGALAGTLDHLLALARAQQINLLQISLPALVDQLIEALRQAPVTMPLGQKADCVVMAASLVQLRSRLLLPVDAPAQQDAIAAAGELQGQLVALQAIQALGGWLARRPQLGHDVFARGRPEVFGVSVDSGQAADVIAFLWASLALFDDTPAPDTAAAYRPRPLDLDTVVEARNRILQRLAESPEGAPFERFLPELPPVADGDLRRAVWGRSAWSSTLLAGLELARQGAVTLAQESDFQPILIIPA